MEKRRRRFALPAQSKIETRIFPGITNVNNRESDCFACAGGDRNRGRARIDGGRRRRFA
jgi:hypothetical protein